MREHVVSCTRRRHAGTSAGQKTCTNISVKYAIILNKWKRSSWRTPENVSYVRRSASKVSKAQIILDAFGKVGQLTRHSEPEYLCPENRIILEKSPWPTLSIGLPLLWFISRTPHYWGPRSWAAKRSFHTSLPTGGLRVAPNRHRLLYRWVLKFLTTHKLDEYFVSSFRHESLLVKGRDLKDVP